MLSDLKRKLCYIQCLYQHTGCLFSDQLGRHKHNLVTTLTQPPFWKWVLVPPPPSMTFERSPTYYIFVRKVIFQNNLSQERKHILMNVNYSSKFFRDYFNFKHGCLGNQCKHTKRLLHLINNHLCDKQNRCMPLFKLFFHFYTF